MTTTHAQGSEDEKTQEEGVERIFFELSSEIRLAILRELSARNLRLQEVARTLDMTDTEAFRQLKRLSEDRLVLRHPDGSYSSTEFARLEMRLASSMEFVFKHKEYFSVHDVWKLPEQFVERIGELSETTLVSDSIESIRRAEKIMGEAAEFHWGIGEGRYTETMGAASVEHRLRGGVEYRILSPYPSTKKQNAENRTLAYIPVFMMLTEKEGLVCFRTYDGKMDYASFSGPDKKFLGWSKDLFLFYWDNIRNRQNKLDRKETTVKEF